MGQSEVAMKELVGSELYQNFVRDTCVDEAEEQGHLRIVRTPEAQEETREYIRAGTERVLQAVEASKPRGLARVWESAVRWLNDESPAAPSGGYHL